MIRFVLIERIEVVTQTDSFPGFAMFQKLALAALCVGFCTAAVSAQNQPVQFDNSIAQSNRYFNLYGGFNALHDYTGEVPPVTQVGTFNGGFILGSAVGRQLNPNLRGEIDNAFRYNSGNTWTGVGTTPFDGRIRNYSTMFNLIRDFRTGAFTPYVGAGIGVAYSDGVFDVGGTTFDTTSAAFAYQGIAGISTNGPGGVEWYTEYRFYGNTDVPLENVPAMTSTNFTYLSHSVILGVRIRR